MAWSRTILDLSDKDVGRSEQFIRTFCGFRVEHLREISLVNTSPGSRFGATAISFNSFAKYFRSGNFELGFGYPQGGITIAHHYDKGALRFSLIDMIKMDHESGVLDAYVSSYMEQIAGYEPKFKR